MTKDEISCDLYYLGESNDLHRSIVDAVARLPAAVAAFALERCAFVSVGKVAWGLTLPRENRRGRIRQAQKQPQSLDHCVERANTEERSGDGRGA